MTTRLLVLGARVSLGDNADNTFLHHAVARGLEQIAYQLICTGVQTECVNTEGTCPLQLAVSIGPAGMARSLLGSAAGQDE